MFIEQIRAATETWPSRLREDKQTNKKAVVGVSGWCMGSGVGERGGDGEATGAMKIENHP